jgi:uncharacterized protein YunC (DUF1805 family)
MIVERPMFAIENRRYIYLRDGSGELHSVKVPFRYNRVMCTVKGLRTIQELTVGSVVEVTMEYSQSVWKLKTISS